MNASADSLPPVPADLWLKVPAAETTRRPGALLTVQVPLFSERLLLSALSRAVHLEMASAGRWAALGGDRPHPNLRRQRQAREAARGFAEQAARLLALYASVYPEVRHGMTALQPSPESLRAEATLTYRQAFQAARRSPASASSEFNDALFAHLQRKPPGGSPGFHR